jgi:hypothetical protein
VAAILMPRERNFAMSTANQIIRVYRCNSAIASVTITMGDGSAFDPALEAAFKWRMAKNWHSPEDEMLLSKELGTGIVKTATGVEITLDASDMDHPPGIYHHELKIEGDEIVTAMIGSVVIKPAMRMTPIISPLLGQGEVISLSASL